VFPDRFDAALQQFVADRYFGSCGAAFGNAISLKLSSPTERPNREQQCVPNDSYSYFTVVMRHTE
jgi:hypothetical protein